MADPVVTASAGGVTITAEVELGDDRDETEPEPPPSSDPVADILGGVVHGVGKVLGGIWDAIKPDDRPPAEPEED